MFNTKFSRRCDKCKAPFVTIRPGQKYCPLGCRYQCKQCGSSFLAKCRSNSSPDYCSSACWYARLRVAGRKPKDCPVCGGTFHGSNKTCGKACARVRHKAAFPPIERKCGWCKVDLVIATASTVRRFCSRRCSIKDRNAKMPPGERCARGRKDGTRRIGRDGYVHIKHQGRWHLEHRLVMSQSIGRPLLDSERVHHRNGDRGDNSLSNLELWRITKKDPPGQRVADIITYVAENFPDQVREALTATSHKSTESTA